jgi:hypothetical protein
VQIAIWNAFSSVGKAKREAYRAASTRKKSFLCGEGFDAIAVTERRINSTKRIPIDPMLVIGRAALTFRRELN